MSWKYLGAGLLLSKKVRIGFYDRRTTDPQLGTITKLANTSRFLECFYHKVKFW